MEVNLIRKPNFAGARSFVEDRVAELRKGKITVINGSGSRSEQSDGEKRLCIMQLQTYILGYDEDAVIDSYKPPCTSEEIRLFLITVNDGLSDRKRAKLIEVLPDVVNTAPMRLTVRTYNSHIRITLVTAESDPDYKTAEEIRADMIENWNRDLDKTSMTIINDFIRKLAAVAKFDSTPVNESDSQHGDK